MAEKQSNKERIKEITAGIEQGIKELFESDRYRKYLTTMSRFHKYSLNNVMLIHSQRPDATLVAGFNKWKNSFGRHVKKGEKGIQILAPTPYKIKVEKEKLDPETKLPMIDENGDPVTEEKEVSIPMFKVVSVFDVSQTEGKPLPQLAYSLSGAVEHYEEFMEALKRTSTVPITVEHTEKNVDGFFDLTNQSITIQAGMSEIQTVCAVIHEIAHSRLHNYDHMTELADDGETLLAPTEKDRHTEEVEAESISYAVCQYFGIETSENSFGYIASWSQGKELKELRASLETINRTSSELISGIEKHFQEICKEKGIDLSVEQKEAAPVQSKEETEALYLVNDTIYLHVQQSDDGWDYTLYDKESMRQIDGGVLESAAVEESPISRPLAAARTEIMELEGIKPETVIYADMAILEKLQEAQITIPANYEKQFLETPGDMVAIYQLKPDAPHGLRFERFDSLKEPPDQLHYECTYSLSANPDIPRDQLLEQQYQTFNIDRPKDFTGQSLSVSDIVALKRNGLISYHYCDWAGYKELDYFKSQDSYPPAVEQILAAPEPDPYCNRSEMLDFGYTDQSMYPISTDFALELMERNVPVYMLYADNTEAMAFDSEDLAMHQGFIGVTKEDWAEVKDNPDIVAIKRHIAVNYLQDKNEDRIRQLAQNNPLRNAEMSLEDDYGMIDGIINNGKASSKEESKEKKPSVIEQLKNQPQQSRKKSTPKKNKEKEL
ncbi:MAG: YodL domain-containing protein [Oscillospiraceae bacterium]|nr:YodL domain-containing protein [Oscillospiraceae bacterium]